MGGVFARNIEGKVSVNKLLPWSLTPGQRRRAYSRITPKVRHLDQCIPPLLPEGAPPIRKAELAPAALSAWVTAGYDSGDSSRYTAAILAAASHPNSALDVRLPSAYWYRWEGEGGLLSTGYWYRWEGEGGCETF